MGRPTDESRMSTLLETLDHAGGSAGNYWMMHELGWSEDEYWRIRDKLVEDGRVLRGRGKGGSVALVVPVDEADAVCDEVDVTVSVNARPSREADLYDPCCKTLRDHWASERGFQQLHVEITAFQGRKATGGDWTRPDIAALSVRTFKHWPGRFFDIWTFEIKPQWEFGVTGVFEAAAHARCATHSYAMFHVGADFDAESELSMRVQSEAQRMGIGLILFSDPNDFQTWDPKVDPSRNETDPALLDLFVSQMSENAREKLSRWSK